MTLMNWSEAPSSAEALMSLTHLLHKVNEINAVLARSTVMPPALRLVRSHESATADFRQGGQREPGADPVAGELPPSSHELPSLQHVIGSAQVESRISAELRGARVGSVWMVPGEAVVPLERFSTGVRPMRILTNSIHSAAARSGLDVRLALAMPRRAVLIVDRISTLVPYRTRDGESALALSRQPQMSALVQSAFEALWQQGLPVGGAIALQQALNAQVKRDIVRLLAAGSTDDMISRQLNISKRTCARHVAQILSCVGASSRFQAGMILARFTDAHAACLAQSR